MLVANWSKCTLVWKRSPKRNGAAIRFHVTRFGLIRDIENHQHQDHEPVKDSKFHVGILFKKKKSNDKIFEINSSIHITRASRLQPIRVTIVCQFPANQK